MKPPKELQAETLLQAEISQPEAKQEAPRQQAQKRIGRQRTQRQRGTKQEEKNTMQNKKETEDQPASAEIPQTVAAETVSVKSSPKSVDPAAAAVLEAVGINASAAEYIQAQAEKYRDDKNKKQLVYRAVVKKYGQKVGTQIYNSTKKILLK